MSAIELCRTVALGGHVERCDSCDHQRICYNSCRDRHCPKCQSLARAQWLEDRRSELLDTQYFHVVFTVPQPIAAIALQNKETVYNILFRATAETLRTIAADPKHLGAQIGFFAVLHTWGQALLAHPHLRCVVPGGGISPPDGFQRIRYFGFLANRYRAEKLALCRQLMQMPPPATTREVDGSRWISCRPNFFLPVPVLAARYTHRVAISNNRLLDIDDGKVQFRWKDYRDDNRHKTMTLGADEFIRRFLLHVLPAWCHSDTVGISSGRYP